MEAVDKGSNYPAILDRVSKLPGLKSTYDFVSQTYSKYGKESQYETVKATCAVLEKQLEDLKHQATPFVTKHRGQLDAADQLLCSQFDRVEEMATSMKTSVSTLQEAVNARTTAVLGTVEHRVCEASNVVLTQADRVVNIVLPETETSEKLLFKALKDSQHKAEEVDEQANEDEETTNDSANGQPVLGSEAKKLLANAKLFSSKVQLRAYSQALEQLQFAKTRSKSAIDSLMPYTVDLLIYARNNLDDIAHTDDGYVNRASKDDSSDSTPSQTVLSLIDPLPVPRFVAKMAKTRIRNSAANVRDIIDFTFDVTQIVHASFNFAKSSATTALRKSRPYVQRTRKFVTSTASCLRSDAGDLMTTVRQNVMLQKIEHSVQDFIQSHPALFQRVPFISLALKASSESVFELLQKSEASEEPEEPESYRDAVVHGDHPDPAAISSESMHVMEEEGVDVDM